MSDSISLRPLAAPQTLLGLAVLPALLWYGNPAVGLLLGACLSLAFDRPVIPFAGPLGKYALQTAIVLLGLKLNAGQLVKISADYSLLVTLYVGSTIALGLLIGRWLGTQKKSSQLVAAGTAICGGSAIAAVAPAMTISTASLAWR